MYKKLIIEQKLASSSGAWYQGGSLDQTEFGLYGTPRPDKRLPEIEKATDEVIATLLKDGVTQQEVDRAKNRLIKSSIFSLDSQATLARIYGASLTLGLTIEEIETWTDRIQKVSIEDVNKVARKYLDLKRSVTGYLTPQSKSEGQEG